MSHADDFSANFESFYAFLGACEFERATQAAQKLGTRRLSRALQHLVSCEVLYLSMQNFASQRSPLERLLDTTARELEGCLSQAGLRESASVRGNWSTHNGIDSSGQSTQQPHAWLKATGAALSSLFTSVMTCRDPSTWSIAMSTAAAASTVADGPSPKPSPTLPRPSATPLDGHASVSTLSSTLSAAQRGALSDTVELLRLRRAMLPIYLEVPSQARPRPPCSHPSPAPANTVDAR
jgi:hypothetical protein